MTGRSVAGRLKAGYSALVESPEFVAEYRRVRRIDGD